MDIKRKRPPRCKDECLRNVRVPIWVAGRRMRGAGKKGWMRDMYKDSPRRIWMGGDRICEQR